MIKATIFLFLLLSTYTISQNSLTKCTKTDFKSWENEYNDSLYHKYLELFRNLDLYKENVDIYGSEYLEDRITILDFDKDGLKDIIYEGYLRGGETEYVVVFQRSKTGFVQILEVAGYPVEVSDPKISENLCFTIKNYGCCQDVVSVLETYTLVNIGNQPQFILTRKFSFMNLEITSFPERYFDEPIPFETTNSKYTLRFTPEVDDSTEYMPHIIGNSSAIYPKGSIGVALAEKEDVTGRIWWFVYMKNNLEPMENNLHSGGNNKRSYYSFGWISSKYVSVIH